MQALSALFMDCRQSILNSVRPVYAEDLAAQAVDAGSRTQNFIAAGAGPEAVTFQELLRLLASAVG